MSAGRGRRKDHGSPVAVVDGSFEWEGRQLHYEMYGSGDRLLVYMHGLLLDAKLNRGIAHALAAKGNRVVLLDLLGHGGSDGPQHAAEYRMDVYARQVIGLLDHLGRDQAVLGGISLGANVSLQAATQHPDRVRGLVIEMPVLEWAVPAAALTFVPVLLALHYLEPIAKVVTGGVRWLPRTGIGPVDSILDAVSKPPAQTASVLHGILVGPVAPTIDERRALRVPALILGHRFDVIHPLDDAANLADELPKARLVRARSPLELRLRPNRLTGEIADFLEQVWKRPGRGRGATEQTA